MIFVTVGTHEQPFDRLIQKIDELKRDDVLQEDVILQTGYSTYEPRYCQWRQFLPYGQMLKNVEAARIVITHGGPGSILMPLRIGKIPIVVPRQSAFGEHVNDHQLEFVRAMERRQGNILIVEDVGLLKNTLLNYETIVQSMSAVLHPNNEQFLLAFGSIVDELFHVSN